MTKIHTEDEIAEMRFPEVDQQQICRELFMLVDVARHHLATCPPADKDFRRGMLSAYQTAYGIASGWTGSY